MHPWKPTAIIDEATASCNSLLLHFHCVVGRKPLDLNWDNQKSKDLVDNDSKLIDSMRSLQAFVFGLSRWLTKLRSRFQS